MYYHFVKCIPFPVIPCFWHSVSLSLVSTTSTVFLYLMCIAKRCGYSFNLRGVWEQISILLLRTHQLWPLECVCNLALAQNVKCLVAPLLSGPVGQLWAEDNVSLFLLWGCFLVWLLNAGRGSCTSGGRECYQPIYLQSSLLRSACQSVLGQDTEPQIASNGCFIGVWTGECWLVS